MKIYQITEQTTIKDLEKYFNDIIRNYTINAKTQTQIKEEIINKLQNDGHNVSNSRGGAHYGHWLKICRETDLKFNIKLKSTGKYIKVSNTKSQLIKEFNGIEFIKNKNYWNCIKSEIVLKNIEDKEYYDIDLFITKLIDEQKIKLQEFDNFIKSLGKTKGIIIQNSEHLRSCLNEYLKHSYDIKMKLNIFSNFIENNISINELKTKLLIDYTDINFELIDKIE